MKCLKAMNILNKIYKNPLLTAFLLAIVFFKLPNFYIFLFLKNSFLTTQAFARIILLGIFTLILIRGYINKISIIQPKRAIETVTWICILLFFSLQSFSIIPAVNLSAFIGRYKDVFLSFVGIYCFYYFRRKYKAIITTIVMGAVISIVYQSFIFFWQDFFVNGISNFVYEKHVLLVLANIERYRIYTDTYDEIAVPFLMMSNIFSIPFPYPFNIITLISISFFAAVSNFRTRILMLFVSVASSIIFIKKIPVKKVVIIVLFFLVTSYITSKLLSTRYGFSYIDRFLLQSEGEDLDPIYSRFDQIKLGLQMGTYSPFGVGLGNYYDHLPSDFKYYKSGFKWEDIRSSGASLYIHNNIGSIIAESGYVSGLVFMVLIMIFLITDLKILIRGKEYQKGFIIAFWTLFIHGLLNPPVPISYQFFFWGIRGLLIDS